MNSVHLCGRLGADPVITNFENGGKSAQFNVAVTERGYKRRDGTEVPERTEWIRVESTNSGISGVAEQYLKRGSFVVIEGRLKTREWEKEGVKHYLTCVVIEKMDFGPKNGNGNVTIPPPEVEQPRAEQPRAEQPKAAVTTSKQTPATTPSAKTSSVPKSYTDDELPF